jgi:hypothetical protein
MRRAELLPLILVFAAVPLSVGQQPQKPKSGTIHTATQTCDVGSEGILKCPRFGFTYKTIFGWVDRTDEMRPDPESEKPESAKPESGAAGTPQGTKSETLLAVFERPPAAPGDTINSAVVIVAESLADYHGIKTAADYFGPITELAEQRGFKVENAPHAFSVGTKQLIRGDFSKERGKLTMWQSSLVIIEKGYVVSFTFVGGSEEEVESLILNLSFGARLSGPPPDKW